MYGLIIKTRVLVYDEPSFHSTLESYTSSSPKKRIGMIIFKHSYYMYSFDFCVVSNVRGRSENNFQDSTHCIEPKD